MRASCLSASAAALGTQGSEQTFAAANSKVGCAGQSANSLHKFERRLFDKISVVRVCALRHLRVMCLMVRTDCHDPEEPEAEDAGKLLIGIDFDTHERPLR